MLGIEVRKIDIVPALVGRTDIVQKVTKITMCL